MAAMPRALDDELLSGERDGQGSSEYLSGRRTRVVRNGDIFAFNAEISSFLMDIAVSEPGMRMRKAEMCACRWQINE